MYLHCVSLLISLYDDDVIVVVLIYDFFFFFFILLLLLLFLFVWPTGALNHSGTTKKSRCLPNFVSISTLLSPDR